MVHILAVDDEQPILELVSMQLLMHGFACDCAADGEQAIERIDTRHYDLILLDIMLPVVDGYELLEYIRPLNIPVIFLTARAGVKDRIRGLQLGADDYLPKPFEAAELVARVEAVLRRYKKGGQLLQGGDVEMDTLARSVKKSGQPISLTPKEFEILQLFLENPNIALFKDTIYERVWGGSYYGDSRTVELHVQRLRKKLGWEDKITTVFKVGYRLEL